MKPTTWAAFAWIGSSLVSVGLGGHALAAPATPCAQSADDVERSCREGAQGDYWLSIAKCDNVSGAVARKACETQASEDQIDAVSTCDDQSDAREAICARLGGAAYGPAISPANFVAKIDNPYFPLKPGTTFVYEARTAGGLSHTEFAVTFNTRVILGIRCVEVHDTVRVNGELAEDTLDWFAQDRDGNVWYFGENTHELEDGLITTIDGSFVAGVDNDKPGIIMRAHPAAGDFYRQEFSLDNAEDVAETLSLKETVTVPVGTFRNCLKSRETTPLEPDALEYKYYAPGVGNVLTIDAVTGEREELIRIVTQGR